MKRIALAAGLAIFASHGASAQSADQLVKGATDTANVLNYGIQSAAVQPAHADQQRQREESGSGVELQLRR